jgi:hypothetical protein
MSDGPSLVIFEPGSPPLRRRGRPRAAEPGVSVKTWLRVSEYDRLIKVAADRREPVSVLVRTLLMLRLPD